MDSLSKRTGAAQMTTKVEQFQKLKIAMRYWLLGMSEKDPMYMVALKAMEYAAEFHRNTRKDGITPEYMHQMEIAHYVRTLHNSILYPAETIAATFLHDVAEDYDVGFEEIREKFGDIITNAVILLTKKHRGEKKTYDIYFGGMSKNPIASIVKGSDRINNLQSMIGVFTVEKQKSYIQEVETYFLPMLKQARRSFPEQEMAYENIKLMLESQCELISASFAE